MNQRDIEAKLGSVVYSKAGRDQGKYYLVTRLVSDNYVYIADGKKHLIAKPKLKKVKHLKITADIMENIAGKIAEDKQVFDKEIVSALRVYNDK